MKVFAIIVILVALYLLYRIAFPKQTSQKLYRENSVLDAKPILDVMGKSRSCTTDRSKIQQSSTLVLKSENQTKNSITFAPETSDDALDVNTDDIPLEYEDMDYLTENEPEEVMATDGEAEYAEGLDFEALLKIKQIASEQPQTVSPEISETLMLLEHTDMFEMLAANNENKRKWIKLIISRHLQNMTGETENQTDEDANYGSFEISEWV
jgi:hypothetical protein